MFRKLILSGLLLLNCMQYDSSAYAGDLPYIAKWYRGYEAAITLRFDDAFESHVNVVVPVLNQYKMRATFMVNPGRARYNKNKDLWEIKVLRDGHQLGNHTMHHIGASSIDEALFEIGETSKKILSLEAQNSKLLVFAAGGGTKWEGRPWKDADEKYRMIPLQLNMIDLYDGNHPATHVISKDTPARLCSLVKEALQNGKHESFVFHDIGSAGVKSYLQYFLKGYHLTYRERDFLDFMQCLERVRKRIWIEPLAQVYKYETERANTKMEVAGKGRSYVNIKINVSTDPNFYDQPLTVVIPTPKETEIIKILQDSNPIAYYRKNDAAVFVDIEPKNSRLQVIMRNISGRR